MLLVAQAKEYGGHGWLTNFLWDRIFQLFVANARLAADPHTLDHPTPERKRAFLPAFPTSTCPNSEGFTACLCIMSTRMPCVHGPCTHSGVLRPLVHTSKATQRETTHSNQHCLGPRGYMASRRAKLNYVGNSQCKRFHSTKLYRAKQQSFPVCLSFLFPRK